MTPRLLDWSSWYFCGAIGFDLQQTSNALYIIHLYPCQCGHHDLHDVTRQPVRPDSPFKLGDQSSPLKTIGSEKGQEVNCQTHKTALKVSRPQSRCLLLQPSTHNVFYSSIHKTALLISNRKQHGCLWCCLPKSDVFSCVKNARWMSHRSLQNPQPNFFHGFIALFVRVIASTHSSLQVLTQRNNLKHMNSSFCLHRKVFGSEQGSLDRKCHLTGTGW